MKLGPNKGDAHLTYCTNIHPGETWEEVAHALRVHLPAVKAKLCPDQDFGVGLRLSAAAAQDLSAPSAFDELQDILASGGLYVFTINGFPYGTFHGTRVKEEVYQPDWRTAERLAYSNQLADLLVRMLPKGGDIDGSISTVPGGFKPDVDGPDTIKAMADNLLAHAAHLVAIRRDTGRTIALALEPEPCCLLETTQGAVDFFKAHLYNAAAIAQLAKHTGKALLGDFQDRQQLVHGGARVAADEIQGSMVSATETVLGQNIISLAGEIPIGKEKEFNGLAHAFAVLGHKET